MSATVASISGEKMTMATSAPKMSTMRLIVALNMLVRGTRRILIMGSPCRSSICGMVGMILL